MTMRLSLKVIAAAALLCFHPSAIANSDQQQSTEGTDDILRSLSMDMANIGFSNEAFDRQFKVAPEQMATGLRKDPDIAEMEAEYPGIVEFMIDAMMPPIYDGSKASLPDIRDRLAKIYAKHFTTRELTNLLDFYRSPTGRKLINGMLDSPDLSAIMADVIADENAMISEQAVTKATRDSARRIVNEQINASDKIALTKFSRMPEFQKINQIAPVINAEVTKWMNEPLPASIDAESERLVTEAIAEYIDASENSRKPKLPVYNPLVNQ